MDGLTHQRRYAIAGYAVILATFGGFGVWATYVRLDRAVISTAARKLNASSQRP